MTPEELRQYQTVSQEQLNRLIARPKTFGKVSVAEALEQARVLMKAKQDARKKRKMIFTDGVATNGCKATVSVVMP